MKKVVFGAMIALSTTQALASSWAPEAKVFVGGSNGQCEETFDVIIDRAITKANSAAWAERFSADLRITDWRIHTYVEPNVFSPSEGPTPPCAYKHASVEAVFSRFESPTGVYAISLERHFSNPRIDSQDSTTHKYSDEEAWQLAIEIVLKEAAVYCQDQPTLRHVNHRTVKLFGGSVWYDSYGVKASAACLVKGIR